MSLPVPVLLIHGLGCSADTWTRTLAQFGRIRVDQAVYAVDLPGYGRSAGPAETLGIEELADWTIQFMDTLGIESVDVAANSMGCQVAISLAARHPNRVRRMLLLGPTVGGAISASQYACRLLADSVHEPFFYNVRLLGMYAQMGLLRYAVTVKKMMEHDVLDRAASVQAPTLVVRGHHDAIATRRAAQALAAALPQGTYAELDRSAHAAHFARPKAFVHTLVSFLTASTVSQSRIVAGRSAA